MMRISRRDFGIMGIAAGASPFLFGCEANRDLAQTVVTIDWVPSAEYYGFFVARAENLFARRNLNVSIRNGTGAPVVAAQLASGAITLGTTTSDNLVRILAKGAKIARAMPILPFNPTTFIMKPGLAFAPDSLRGKIVGVNVQSAGYRQLHKALSRAGIRTDSFKEYPIGFGGVDEFASGRLDAFVGYTTNHAVDLALRNVPFEEVRLDQLGISSAGIVLVATREAEADLSATKLGHLFSACAEGFAVGAQRLDLAVNSLKTIDASLDSRKLRAAIQKSVRLTKEDRTQRWDDWLKGEAEVTDHAIAAANSLLSAGDSPL